MVWKMLYNHCRKAAVCAKRAASSPAATWAGTGPILKPPETETGQKGQVGQALQGGSGVPGTSGRLCGADSRAQAGCDVPTALFLFRSTVLGDEGAFILTKRKRKKEKPPSPRSRLGYFHFNFLLGGARSAEAQGRVRDRSGGLCGPRPLAVAAHHLSPRSGQVGALDAGVPGREPPPGAGGPLHGESYEDQH